MFNMLLSNGPDILSLNTIADLRHWATYLNSAAYVLQKSSSHVSDAALTALRVNLLTFNKHRYTCNGCAIDNFEVKLFNLLLQKLPLEISVDVSKYGGHMIGTIHNSVPRLHYTNFKYLYILCVDARSCCAQYQRAAGGNSWTSNGH